MQLKLTTDYSIRVLLYLGQKQGYMPVFGEEIARAVGVTPSYFRKVATNLRDKGLLKSDQGSQGGFYLAHPPAETTLRQVISACEDTMTLNRCLDEPGLCSRSAASWCKVRDYLSGLQNELNDKLGAVTLEELL